MSRGFASNRRIALLATLVLCAFGALGVRLVWLHVLDRKELLGFIQKARREIISEGARRGNILDVKSSILATSRSLIVLGVDPGDLRPGDEKLWPQLAQLIDMPLAQLRTIFTTKFHPQAIPGPARILVGFASPAVPPAVAADPAPDETVVDEPDPHGRRMVRWAKLSDQVTETTYAEISKLNIQGVVGSRVYRRAYPHHELAAHLVGYVNEQQAPVCGLEHYLNFYLRGEDGWVESEKDGHRQELAQFRTREVPPADGYNAVLSIDAAVQSMIEQELDFIAKKYQPLKATIIVSDPRTGFILALGNYPTYDLNAYNKLTKEQQAWMQNVAVDAEYEPGSVFKIVAASGAIDQGLVNASTKFDCSIDKIEYNGKVRGLPVEDEPEHFVHPVTIAEIIAHSSNRGAAQLAMRLGDQRFYDYARAFGFGQRTGFPVGGEIPGTLVAPDKWDGVTITRLPMGQGAISATPIQMQQAMGAIASGGVLLRPQIIRAITDPSGEIIYRYQAAAVRRVMSAETARTMARLLERVASVNGTAVTAEIPGYEVAGKTGTTEKLFPVLRPSGKIVREYSKRHHVVSFVGFLPASHPQVEISVIVDDADARAANGVAYGAAVAAPSFKRLALKLIPYLDIRPGLPEVADRTLALEGGRR